MVLPASAADEGQAGRSAWLERIRAILELGREGVLILVPDAKLAQLRPLMRALWAIDEGARIVVEAESLAECVDNELIVLVLRAQDASWLNRNRPLFAQRRLRVVLWGDEEVVGEMRGRAPDFFDWISHVVECPFAVPEFTRRGLELGMEWHPGAVWRGGLELRDVLRHLGIFYIEGPRELDKAVWVHFLSECEAQIVCVSGLRSSDSVALIYAAMIRTGFAGRVILDEPKCATPAWVPVDAQQVEPGALRWLEFGVRVELEREFIELVEELGLAPPSAEIVDLDAWLTDAARKTAVWSELVEEVETGLRGGPLSRFIFERSEALVQRFLTRRARLRRVLVDRPKLKIEGFEVELGHGERFFQWEQDDLVCLIRDLWRASERGGLFERARQISTRAERVLGPRSRELAELSQVIGMAVGLLDRVGAARSWLERAGEDTELAQVSLAGLDLLDGRIAQALKRLEARSSPTDQRERQLLVLALRMSGANERATAKAEEWVAAGQAKAEDFDFGSHPRQWLEHALRQHFEDSLSAILGQPLTTLTAPAPAK
jgi:hypothetical protein